MSKSNSLQASPEATSEGLRLAKEAGQAYQRMVNYFIENVAQEGHLQEKGDYKVGIAVEGAEPLWHLSGDELELAEPPVSANQHLEVVVTDVDDGRFIPELEINVTLLDSKGQYVGNWDLPFLWHPTMYHYGRNVSVPHSGQYTVRVSIARPTFFRHDKDNGKRYQEPEIIEFKNVHFKNEREAR